jgi:hypothetical protein
MRDPVARITNASILSSPRTWGIQGATTCGRRKRRASGAQADRESRVALWILAFARMTRGAYPSAYATRPPRSPSATQNETCATTPAPTRTKAVDSAGLPPMPASAVQSAPTAICMKP